jgi:hypothetical protein
MSFPPVFEQKCGAGDCSPSFPQPLRYSRGGLLELLEGDCLEAARLALPLRWVPPLFLNAIFWTKGNIGALLQP